METKHTKGEWKIIHRSSHTNYQSFDVVMIGCTYEEMPHNEKLIVCSPKLLEFIQRMASENNFIDDTNRQEAFNLINEATI